MSDKQDTRAALNEWVTMVADEITSDDQTADVYDLIHESVDGSEWVIYYSKAADLIESLSDERQEQAYTDSVELGTPASYGDMQTGMAYAALCSMLTEEIESRRE